MTTTGDMEKKLITASDAFVYDEAAAVPIRRFFHEYRDQFPMLAIMIDGICGDTCYDCYDCDQVFRIHGYTSQPRVVAIDSGDARFQSHNYITIPVNTHERFKVVKSHLSVGHAQSLEEILSQNDLPVLVEMAAGPGYKVHAPLHGKYMHVSTLLITTIFEEHFLMINCIDHPELCMHKQHCLVAMSNALTAAPITGFRYRSGAEFAEFLAGLDELVATGGEVYNLTRGNSDMDICTLETGEIDPQLVTSKTDIFPPPIVPDEPPPPVPTRKGKHELDDEGEGRYEEISANWEPKPLLPPRKPRNNAPSSKEPQLPKATSRAEQNILFEKVREKCTKTQTEKRGPDRILEKPKQANISDRKTLAPPAARETDADTDADIYSEPADPADDIRKVYEELQHADSATGTAYSLLNVNSYDKHFKARSINRGHDSCKNDYINVTYDSRKVASTKETPTVMNKPPPENNTSHDVTSLQRRSRDNHKNTQRVTTNRQFPEELSYTKRKTVAENVNGVHTMTIDEIGSALHQLKLTKYVNILRDEMIDGAILSELTVNDFVNEFGFSRVEAVRLYTFIDTGHIPH